jgi:hypothetical protein
MTKITAITDPWAHAAASWVPLPGTRADRAQAQSFLKPALWQHVICPEDRALLAQLAGEVLDADPGVGHAFAARLLERLRVRQGAATSESEQAQLHNLDALVSRHLASLPDLLRCLRAFRAEAA